MLRKAAIATALALVLVASLIVSVSTSLADEDDHVASGQIIVHTDTRETHVIPSPAGDPNLYRQLKLFQDFTGDFTGSGTAIFISTVHHDGKFPDGTVTFTGREAEFGTIFGHTGAFYFDDSDAQVTPDGKVSGKFTSDGGILGFEDFRAEGAFFPTKNPSVNGNLSHTADYSIKVHFAGRALPGFGLIRLAAP
ncbi:MAG: hypothetical protein JOZ65_35555 [Chloroflexi bacterium]|nr:hypothetical protein [Chloroflexota bacterium]